MLVVGIRCTKDKLDWAVLAGESRQEAQVVEQRQATVTGAARGEQLAWVRKEILELVGRHQLDAAAARVHEPSGQSTSVGRAEVEGVVQEALSSSGLEPSRHVAATIRGLFKARTNHLLAEALKQVPVVAATAATRREPVISAVALLPD